MHPIVAEHRHTIKSHNSYFCSVCLCLAHEICIRLCPAPNEILQPNIMMRSVIVIVSTENIQYLNNRKTTTTDLRIL